MRPSSGVRSARADTALINLSSALYWLLYRFFVMPEIPHGGADVFACNRLLLEALLTLEERNSFSIGQLFWLGFWRIEIRYEREPRTAGKSAWAFRRRLRYVLDSLFAFSDLPITVLLWLRIIVVGISLLVGFVVIVCWLFGFVDVRGYVPIMLAVTFIGSMRLFSQGIVGCYIWQMAGDTRKRPLTAILSHRTSQSAQASRLRGLK